jgi:hypothetical protein
MPFKSRVLACSQRVTDILDLKACTDGVKEALAEEDYETVIFVFILTILFNLKSNKAI